MYEHRVQALAFESRRIPLQSEHWTAAKMPFKSNGKAHLQAAEAIEVIGLTDKTMIRFDNGIM